MLYVSHGPRDVAAAVADKIAQSFGDQRVVFDDEDLRFRQVIGQHEAPRASGENGMTALLVAGKLNAGQSGALKGGI